MNDEMKFLLRNVEIALHMGQIEVLSKSDIEKEEKMERIQRVCQNMQKAREELK